MTERPISPGNEDGHYSGEYQPMDFGAEFNTPMYQICQILKYLSRHRKKGGILDLRKSMVFIESIGVEINNGRIRRSSGKEVHLKKLERILGDSLELWVMKYIYQSWVDRTPVMLIGATSALSKLALVEYGESL